MDGSTIKAIATRNVDTDVSGGTVEVTAEQVALSNHSSIATSTAEIVSDSSPGAITLNAGTFSATDSTFFARNGGSVTIQGFQGSDAYAHSISLTNTEIATREIDGGNGGPILLRAANITLNKSTLSSDGRFAPGGSITLVSSRGLDIQGSVIRSGEGTTTGQGGTVNLTAGTGITLTNQGLVPAGHRAALLP